MQFLWNFNSRAQGPAPCTDCHHFKETINKRSNSYNRGDENVSRIAGFYKGQSVFITGGTGFLGKVLIEKLLRCTDVKMIYALVRAKGNQNPENRIKKLLESKIFDRIRNDAPESLKRLQAIAGDVTLPGMGISMANQATLIKEVSIVFHSAATIKFNDSLRTAMDINVFGTQKVLNLSQQLPLLKALVYVSTAYSNCNLTEVNERVYPLNISTNDFADIDEKDLPKLLAGRPNTYTLSKAMAENLLEREKRNIPLAIVRPSIVTSANKEPYPGWLEIIHGLGSLVSVICIGALRKAYCKKECVIDIVPVDHVINCLLAVALETSYQPKNTLKVYNITSGCFNPSSFGSFSDMLLTHVKSYPITKLLRYPAITLSKSSLLTCAHHFFNNYVPAMFLDTIARMTGRKPRLVKLCNKLSKEMSAVEYFQLRSWRFHGKNVAALIHNLTRRDKIDFDFDISDVDWNDYMETAVKGCREYLFREDQSTLPEGKKALARAYKIEKMLDILKLMVLGQALFFTGIFSSLCSFIGSYFSISF